MKNIEVMKNTDWIKPLKEDIEKKLGTIKLEKTNIEIAKGLLKQRMKPGDHVEGVFYCPVCDEIVLTEKLYEIGGGDETMNVCPNCAPDYEGWETCNYCGKIFKRGEGRYDEEELWICGDCP